MLKEESKSADDCSSIKYRDIVSILTVSVNLEANPDLNFCVI